jgi:hypothetical protein
MSFASDFEGLSPPGAIQWNQDRTAGLVNYADPRQQFVYFYRRSVQDDHASRNAGRRIFKGMDYVKIQPPGERLTVIDRPVTEDDKRRWSQQWYQYANNHTQIPDGTPIDLLWPDHPEVGDTLRACGVHTVEQCANLSAHAIESVGIGAQEYQNRAKRYMEQAERGISHQQFENARAEDQQKIRLLTQQVQQLQSQLDKALGMLEGAPMGTMGHGGYQPPVPVPGFGAQQRGPVHVPVPGYSQPSSGAVHPGPGVDLQAQQINATHASREEGSKRVVSEETRAKLRAAWERRRAAGGDSAP